MSDYAPYDQTLGILERKKNLLDLSCRTRAGVKSYNVYGSKNLMDVYGDPEGAGVTGGSSFGRKLLFNVKAEKRYRSNRYRGWAGAAEEKNKHTSRMLVDMSDFLAVPENAQAHVTCASVVAADEFEIDAAVTFTAVAGVADPSLQEFTVLGGDAAVATSLAAAINDAASQALIVIATGGPSLTATVSGTRVILQADTAGSTGEIAITSTNATRLALSGATLVVRQPIGPEEGIHYLALQEVTSSARVRSNGDPILGPILIVPSPSFFGTRTPTLSLSMTAPANMAGAAGVTPYSSVLDNTTCAPLAIYLPAAVAIVNIRNSASAALLYSTGWGNPYSSLPVSVQTDFQAAGSRLWIFESATATPTSFTFEVTFSLEA